MTEPDCFEFHNPVDVACETSFSSVPTPTPKNWISEFMARSTEEKSEALCSIFMCICPSWWHANWLAWAQDYEAQVSCSSHSASCLLWRQKGQWVEWGWKKHCSTQDGSLLGIKSKDCLFRKLYIKNLHNYEKVYGDCNLNEVMFNLHNSFKKSGRMRFCLFLWFS